MPQPPYLQTGESVVLYDGVCKLCTGWVRFLLRHRLARQVRFASVQSEEGKALLRWAGLPDDNISARSSTFGMNSTGFGRRLFFAFFSSCRCRGAS